KRKIIQACDACRKKKIKCDGEENQVCTNCQRRKVSCVYTPTTAKRGPRQGYIETLEKRLELME
ncbi:nuclear protein, partial [Conidiobolus coronatus NRRL 28638]